MSYHTEAMWWDEIINVDPRLIDLSNCIDDSGGVQAQIIWLVKNE